jgi:hypothetical protein
MCNALNWGACLAGLELGGKARRSIDRIGSRGPIAHNHNSGAAERAFRARAQHQLRRLLLVTSETRSIEG